MESPFETNVNAVLFLKARTEQALNSMLLAAEDETIEFDFESEVDALKVNISETVNMINDVNEQFE